MDGWQLQQKGERYKIDYTTVEPRFRCWVHFYIQARAFSFLPAVQRMRRTRLAPTEGLAERLATVPRIVADDQAVDVSGVEITGEERERWQAQRSANINKYTVNPFGEPRFWGECLVRGLVVLCPVLAIVVGVGVLGYNAGALVVGAAKDNTYIPSERDSVRLAALFGEHARSTTFRNEVSNRIFP